MVEHDFISIWQSSTKNQRFCERVPMHALFVQSLVYYHIRVGIKATAKVQAAIRKVLWGKYMFFFILVYLFRHLEPSLLIKQVLRSQATVHLVYKEIDTAAHVLN